MVYYKGLCDPEKPGIGRGRDEKAVAHHAVNIPGFQTEWALSGALSRLLLNDKRSAVSSTCSGKAFHSSINLIKQKYFPNFHLTLFNFVICFGRLSKLCILFHVLRQQIRGELVRQRAESCLGVCVCGWKGWEQTELHVKNQRSTHG